MTSQPNILLVFTDQQRLDTISGLANNFGVKTPNLDWLVARGVCFENCHCTAPICSASRATMMTGLYPSQAGMPGILYGPCPPLDASRITLAKRLRMAGYETVYNGKWHLGGHVTSYGFDHGEECSYDEQTRHAAARYWRDRDWVEHERPFFHVVSFLNPHDIYFLDPDGTREPKLPVWPNAGDDLAGKAPVQRVRRVEWTAEKWEYYRQFYGELVERVDREVGELLYEFRCSGFLNNSWIVFTADHGDMAGEHGIPFKGPFMYEGVNHIPLIIVPPQTRFLGADRCQAFEHSITPHRTSILTSNIDLVPTLLDIAGIEADPSLPGKSLLPIVRQESNAEVHDAIFGEWHCPPIRMVRTTDWKYVYYLSGEDELYHLSEDPDEMTNLSGAKEQDGIKRELRARLDRHLRDTRDPFYGLGEDDVVIKFDKATQLVK